MLNEGNRIIKGFRREQQLDGSYKFVIRFAGYVWQIQDVGDTEKPMSSVTCMDAMQRLNSRYVRALTAPYGFLDPVVYENKRAFYIAKHIVQNTHSYSNVGINVTEGSFPNPFAHVIESNPVGFWRLGEASGATATDSMSANNGTYVNTPTYGVAGVDDAGNTAITFNGTDEYMSVGNPAALQLSTGTLEAWVKTKTANTATYKAIAAKPNA